MDEVGSEIGTAAEWMHCAACRVDYMGFHDCSGSQVTIRPITPMGWKCPECLQVWAPSVESCKNHRHSTCEPSDFSPRLDFLSRIGQP